MKKCRGRLTIIAAGVHLIFAGGGALANPTGPQVVSGAAALQRPDASTLNITNSPGAIINWQGFSIGAGELTRFIQQSSSSAVLNRVVGADISQIHGQLLSNGRVFLINPGGIVIGPGAVVDTAGFVASTLNMLDADFLAGKLKFQGDAKSGAIVNQGWIRTGYGGQVILVAPQIENSGLIHTPGGELILAAGQKLTITSLDLEGVQFEVQAPTDSVLNVGKLLADGGAVGVFAGTLRHSGEIRANALVYDEAGRIVLKAQNDIQIAAGSTTTADGKTGGNITIQSGQGLTRVAGQVAATGSAGQGGDIRLLGDRVAVVESAVVDASGSAGVGQILVGGDYQGNNSAIQNSSDTFVGSAATLRADATQSGEGGRIIVWSDDQAQFYGNLSAQGGAESGNGGFAEVSGKQNLIFAGSANLGALKGKLGTLLLDPLDLFVFAGGGLDSSIINESTDFPSNAATVSPATLAGITGNVSLFASRYMRISDAITLTTPGQGLTAQVGTYSDPALPDPLALSTGTIFNELELGANITTAGGAVSLIAPTIQSVATSTISTAGGAISLNTSGSTIQAPSLSLDAGSGAVTATSGSFIQLGAVTGGSFTATAPSFLSTGAITTGGGAVSLTSTGSSIFALNIAAGSGSVSLSGSSVSTGTIDTTGGVSLVANSGSINATVNNSSSLTASAAFSASINSSTDLNVANVTAGSTGAASLNTTNGSIRATSSSSQVKGLDVSLFTGFGTGGGIGSAATALNVDAQRNFTFQPNGEFNIFLNGTGPIGLNAQIGPAPATQSYSGTLTKQGGGLTLNASANDTTVTLSSLDITSGFDQQVFFANPSITVQATNGASLVADSVTVATGDTQPTVPSVHTEVPLPVFLSASGNLTLSNYTRISGGLAKSTTISAGGVVSLGNVDASKDAVLVTGPTGITVSSLISTGNVTLTSNSNTVNAQSDNVGVEITSGGTISITGRGIGTAPFGNPLDLAGASIILTDLGGPATGIGGANPVIANTQNLTVNATNGSTFNVSTGATALTNLTLTANPIAVGDTGLAQVSTAGGGAVYVIDADALGKFAFSPPASTGRNVTFTSTTGDIALGQTNLGTGNLTIAANNGEINTGGGSITAANVTLSAASNIDTDTAVITATDTAGSITLHGRNSVTTGALNAPSQVKIDGCFFFCGSPTISVGAIGGSSAPTIIDISGGAVTATGAVTGAGNITLDASGLLTVGGAITGGSGSTITLGSGGATPFVFSTINAGNTGEVNITSSNGIRQQFGGSGITAQTIQLLAANGDIHGLDSMGGATNLDLLNGANNLNLTVNAGSEVLLNANGGPFDSINIATSSTGPDTGPISLINMGGSQSLTVSDLGNGDFNLALNSPSSPLDFTFTANTTGIRTTGSGIVTSGGDVTLTSFGGGIHAATGGITTNGGNVQLTANSTVNTGAINTSGSGGSIQINTFNAAGNIIVGGNLTTGTGGAAIRLNAFSGGDITRSGSFSINSDSSVAITTSNGEIGTSGTPLLLTSPIVVLNADRGGSATGNEGLVSATLTGTSALDLTGAHGFNVTSDTDFSTLSVSTRGSGTGTVALDTPGQNFGFARPASDLFGAVTNTFQIVSVGGTPVTNATFAVSDGTLLVAGPGTINATNLTLSSTAGADISLQGTAANPLSLSNTTQNLNAAGSTTADLLIKGNVTLTGGASQTFAANGNININADAGGGGGGGVTITAPTQQFTTTGSASKIEFLGGAAAGEKVTVTATTQQRVDATSTSADSFKLKGGSGTDASVTLSHSGSGIQDFNMSGGTVTVEGGAGQNAFAKIEETGANQQKICRDTIFGCIPVSALQILGGSGTGAYAQVTSIGSQNVGVSSATTVKAGTGDGAYALLQSGTTQTIFGGGNLTVEGQGGAGAVGKAEILASGFQSITAGNIAVKAGASNGAFARIATTGNQSISGAGLALTAEGTEASPLANASAIIEGDTQSISTGAITLTGGAGTDASNTSDAVLRNLSAASGDQTINASSITMNGGHQFSTTGILNPASGGSQTVSAFGGITLTSDPDAHADASVLIRNLAATTQSLSASSGGIRLNSGGAGTIGITSGGTQTATSRYVEVLTTSGATMNGGTAEIFAAGNQRIHTTNQSGTTGTSIFVSAGGTGTAKIETSASQLLEVGYPEFMQAAGTSGILKLGDVNARGTSLIQAVDQNVFAGSIVVQSGDVGSLSKLSSSNNQTISTLLAGIQVLGGSGADSLATIDPVTQTILSNGTVALTGGSGVNADASIVSAGTQSITTTSGDIALAGGSGAGADAFISSLGAQTLLASDNIALVGGGGSNADASIVTAGPQIVTAATGDITLTGGTGPGADAFLSGGPPQTISAPGGSIVLTQAAGSAFISGPPTPATTTLIDTTSLILPLQEDLSTALFEITPPGEETDPTLTRRVPICR